MTFREAAIRVLHAARRPLTTDEIVARAVEHGLLTSAGKTPEASMSAVLYRSAADPTGPITQNRSTRAYTGTPWLRPLDAPRRPLSPLKPAQRRKLTALTVGFPAIASKAP